MIQRYDNSIPLRDFLFDQVSIWIQAHDIPVCYLNREVAEDLCEAVEVVNRDSIITDVDRRCVMRIRVRVDVSLPLCQGRICSLENGSRGWVSFKYKHLSNICYWCGCLNHFCTARDPWTHLGLGPWTLTLHYGPRAQSTCPKPNPKPAKVTGPSLITLRPT